MERKYNESCDVHESRESRSGSKGPKLIGCVSNDNMVGIKGNCCGLINLTLIYH